MTGDRVFQSGGEERGAVYSRLGVEPIINAATTFTIVGGSLMPPEVLDAMRQAAEYFVDLVELQEAVGRRVAALTRNEAAFVSGGAAAGLFLSAAACMARDTDEGILRLEDLQTLPRDVIIHRAHRNPYDPAIELAGARLVEIGGLHGTNEDELDRVLGSSTAAVLYLAGAHRAAGALPLETVVHIARRHGIPVIVDAAAQLPPAENLWRYTQAGADLALFSGGKALCGPASTGLVLGSARYVELVARNAAPLHRPGRPMKVGKEDLVGLLAALEWFLRQDHEAVARRYDEMVDHFVSWGHERGDVTVTREELGEAGQPTPRARIRLVGGSVEARDELLVALRAMPPRIEVLAAGDDAFYVAPETLLPGEEAVVSRRLSETLDRAQGAPIVIDGGANLR